MLRLVLVSLALLATEALAAPNADIAEIQRVADVGSLEGGAWRFTVANRPLATATVYEARPVSGGYQRTIVTLTPQPGAASGWLVVGRETKRYAGETFQYFAAQIDAAIAVGADGAACPDEPTYYAEHGTAAVTGGCGLESPNARIARALGLIDDTGVYSGRKSGTER